MPLLTENLSGVPEHQRPNFDGFIYIPVRRHLNDVNGADARRIIRLASAPFRYFGLSKFEFRVLTSVCEAWWRSRTQKLRRVGKNSGSILSRLWTKVHQILRRCRRPLVISNALRLLSISCFIPKIFAIKSRSRRRKTNKYITICWPPNFFRKDDPTFLRQIVSASYFYRLAKFGSVCWPPDAKPGNEVKCRIYGGWLKMTVQF